MLELKPQSKPDSNRTLIWASLACVALWVIPYGALLTLPFLYLNTLVHEYGHAIAVVLTGGSVGEVRIETDASGTTTSMGGFGLAIAAAGYVGASIAGAICIARAQNERAAKQVLVGLTVLIALGALLWVRNGFGLAVAIAWSSTTYLLARYSSGETTVFAAQFLGAQQCLNAVQSLWVLLRINAAPGIENDAVIASQMIPIPPLAWALAWCGLSGLLMALALRHGLKGSSSSRAG